MAFDPDKYLADLPQASAQPSAFDPDAYLVQIEKSPEEALRRYNENAQLTQLLGGEPLNAEGKTYSQTQGIEDAKLIRRQLLSQQQSQAQTEAAQQSEIEKTGALGSVLAGAQTGVLAPLSLGASGLQAAASKLGLPENPMDVAIQQSVAEIQARAAQNPLSGTVGTIIPTIATGGIGGAPQNIASALTAGSLKAAVPFLVKANVQAGTSGAINTLINTGVRKVAGLETTAEDIVGDVAFGLLGGRKPELEQVIKSGGRKIFPILNDKQTLASIRLEKAKENVTNILADIGAITNKDPSKQERLVNGSYVEILPEIAPFIKPKSGTEGFLDAVEAASKERALVFKPLVEEINPFLLREENLLPKIEERLAFDLPEPTSRSAALKKVMPYIENVNSKNLLPFSGQLNDNLIRFYKSATPEASADLAFAQKAVRDAYSDIIRTGLEEAGVSPTIYSKYGLINELGDIIGENFRKESIAQKATRGKGFTARMLESDASLLTPRGLAMAAGKAAAPLLKGEPGRIDSQINRIFSQITPAERITPSDFNEIYDAARKKRADLDKVAEFETSLLQAQQEKLAADIALNASPKELQGELSKLMNESVTIEEAGGVGRALDETLPEGLKESYKALRRLPTDGPQGLLSNYQHALNTSGDSINIARLETELRRRLDLKKDAKHWPVIRDLLGIPPPRTQPNLPTKRELNLSEMIDESISP